MKAISQSRPIARQRSQNGDLGFDFKVHPSLGIQFATTKPLIKLVGKPRKHFLGANEHFYKWVRPSGRPLRLFVFGDIDVLISTAWPVLALVKSHPR